MSTQRAPDDSSRFAGAIYLLMLVVVLAFGGFMWQVYSPPEAPRINAPPEPYKVRPPADSPTEPDRGEQTEIVEPDQPRGRRETPTVEAPRPGAAPYFVSNGPYVAQLAALQSEAAVGPAWRRLSSRAPRLFERAQLDVERADLGPRGVYFRVRAGYFPDRANAARFCERIRRMGQDCIVAAR